MNPKITVLMAAHNAAAYLRDSVESILNQTFSNFEFLLIDDGSSDDTVNILNYYDARDNRFRIIRNRANIGLTRSLNIGLSQARGRYIARQDSDDISLLDRLQHQVNFLDRSPEIFLVGGGAVIIDELNNTLKRSNTIIGSKKIASTLVKQNCILHPTIMFRRLPGTCYREKFRYAQDYDFYLICLSHGLRLENVNKTLIKKRITPDSIREKHTISQALFAEKARIFYEQRRKIGKDDYDSFKPGEILTVNLNQAKNTRMGLSILIKNAVSKRDFHTARRLITQYQNQYGPSLRYQAIYAISFLPTNLFNYLGRLNKNLSG